MLKPLVYFSAAMLLGITSSGPISRSTKWMIQEAAPAQPAGPATTQKNPVKPTAESQARAKKIFGYDCALCHGENGNGKTDLAKDMDLKLTDLTDPKTLAGETDGELFDIIKNGKGKMPSEDTGRAKTDEVWNLVIYVRKMAKA